MRRGQSAATRDSQRRLRCSEWAGVCIGRSARSHWNQLVFDCARLGEPYGCGEAQGHEIGARRSQCRAVGQHAAGRTHRAGWSRGAEHGNGESGFLVTVKMGGQDRSEGGEVGGRGARGENMYRRHARGAGEKALRGISARRMWEGAGGIGGRRCGVARRVWPGGGGGGRRSASMWMLLARPSKHARNK